MELRRWPLLLLLLLLLWLPLLPGLFLERDLFEGLMPWVFRHSVAWRVRGDLRVAAVIRRPDVSVHVASHANSVD
jgi:hypothetical protein